MAASSAGRAKEQPRFDRDLKGEENHRRWEDVRMRSLCPIEIFGLSRLTLGWGTVRLGAHPGVPGELMCGDLAAV